MFKNKPKKLLDTTAVSETIKKLGDKPVGGKTKVHELMEDFHENGILLAMVFFSLPVAIPLPYPPGFTTIMGIPLMILSVQMLLGSKKVQLPKKINEYELNNSSLKAISDKVVPKLVSVEKYIRPRMAFAKSVYCEQMVGLISLVAAFSVALPIPLTNALPALGISVMSLGLLNRDGLVILGGVLITAFGLVIATGAVLGSWVVIKYIFRSIL